MDLSEMERVLDNRLKPIQDSVDEIKQGYLEVAKAVTIMAVQAETIKNHRDLIDHNAEADDKAHDELYTRIRIAEQDIAKNKDCKLDSRVDKIEERIQNTTWDLLKGIIIALFSAAIGAIITGKILFVG